MDEQLPGGQISGLRTRIDNNDTSATCTRSVEHEQDHSLLRTALRWTDDGWYIVTSDDAGKASSREGPFHDLSEVEWRMRTQVNARAEDPNNPWLENDEPSERIATVTREGLTHRLLGKARAWIDAIDATGGIVGLKKSLHVFDARLAAGENAAIDDSFRKMQDAVDAYDEWLGR